MHAAARPYWLLLALLCLLAAASPDRRDPTEPEQRVETFLEETARLFGDTEADIVRRLGQPQTRQATPFTSPHDDAPYEVISLRYDGLAVALYSMEGGQRQFLHRIAVTAGPTCFARGICLGTPREQLAASLGQPEDREAARWRYADMSGYNELLFTFDAKGNIASMTWTAEAD